ncbi:hypothetical protein AVEN_208199-1, partial [Araneus ventricosus]
MDRSTVKPLADKWPKIWRSCDLSVRTS